MTMHRSRRGAPWRFLLQAACLVALAAALGTVWGAAAATHTAFDPTLTLEPDRGSCDVSNPPLTVRGAGFAPGQRVVLLVSIVGFPGGSEAGTATAGANGDFALQTRIFGCDSRIGEGTQFRISAFQDEGEPGRPRPGEVLATATFTVTATQAGATTSAAFAPGR